jgi:hypothetical protein
MVQNQLSKLVQNLNTLLLLPTHTLPSMDMLASGIIGQKDATSKDTSATWQAVFSQTRDSGPLMRLNKDMGRKAGNSSVSSFEYLATCIERQNHGAQELSRIAEGVYENLYSEEDPTLQRWNSSSPTLHIRHPRINTQE